MDNLLGILTISYTINRNIPIIEKELFHISIKILIKIIEIDYKIKKKNKILTVPGAP